MTKDTITVDLTDHFKYEPEILVYVGTSVQQFINMIESHGGAVGLHQQKRFAIMFNTEPDIDKIENYKIVGDKYPNSHRILREQYWLGSIPEWQHAEVVKKYLDHIFDMPYYKSFKYIS